MTTGATTQKYVPSRDVLDLWAAQRPQKKTSLLWAAVPVATGIGLGALSYYFFREAAAAEAAWPYYSDGSDRVWGGISAVASVIAGLFGIGALANRWSQGGRILPNNGVRYVDGRFTHRASRFDSIGIVYPVDSFSDLESAVESSGNEPPYVCVNGFEVSNIRENKPESLISTSKTIVEARLGSEGRLVQLASYGDGLKLRAMEANRSGSGLALLAAASMEGPVVKLTQRLVSEAYTPDSLSKARDELKQQKTAA